MSHYEIEVKSLIGDKAQADELKAKMCNLDPNCGCISSNKQLNHYFTDGDMEVLYEKVNHLFLDDQKEKLRVTIDRGEEFSIRTRQKNEEVLFVVKASIDEGTSANTVKRIEFEEPVSISLEELDQLMIEAGFTYLSKWSREREEYEYKGVTVCLDKNGGYGYLAEFEKIVPEENMADEVRSEIDTVMSELGATELDQERLARMFEFYNQNWPEYYGTEKTFVIE